MSAFLVSQRGLTMLADGVDDAINKGKVANFPVECDKTISEILISKVSPTLFNMIFIWLFALVMMLTF